ncbi:MAG TPA: DUF2142 domain-containing protein [Rhizomicrobium sp.]
MSNEMRWRFFSVPDLVRRWLWIFAAPQRQFLFFASIGSIVLLALIPPLAGGNETYNFQRVASIAALHPLIEPASVPSGVVRLLDQARRQFPEGARPPFRYSSSQFRSLAAIPLAGNVRAILEPNAIAVLNPVAYIPQAAAYWLGEASGLSPLVLFYLGRIAGAAAGIGLTFLAIRRMPFNGYGLSAVAMLPTIAFSRSTLDADQFTNGLAFFFAANVLAIIVRPGQISARSFAAIAVSAFLIAQCKSAYLVLPPFAFAIPPERYGSWRRWLLASAVIVLPGILMSVGWMVVVKHTFFAGIHYRTWAGNVYPDGQMARILADPLAYAAVLLRTIFGTNLVPMTLLGFIGVFGPPVEMPPIFYVLLLACLIFVLSGEGDRELQRPPPAARCLALGALVAGFVLILTLLYVQWNGVGATVVEGFQGRYLYPLAAPLLIFLPRRKPTTYFGLAGPQWSNVLGFVALFGTILVTWTTYWS